MTVRDYKEVVRIILDILSENEDKIWQVTDLSEEGARRTGMNKRAFDVPIKTLYSMNMIQGRGSRGKPVSVWHKKEEEGGENEDRGHANDQAVREANAACEQWKKNYEGAKKGLESSAKMLAELQEQLKSKTKEIIVGIKITEPDGTERQTNGFFHEKFKRITDLALMRQNIFLYGPTGSGKTFVCRQLAEVLGMDFSFVSCSSGMSEGTLGGRLLPVGDGGKFEYIVSEYLQRYENGGVFLADEMDAADANVLIFLNASLANGKCAVPNRPDKPYAKRHKDFIFIGASNTVGTGADRMYSGRNKLDMATLDRFQTGKVFIDYDTKVEEGIAAQFTEERELLNWCWKVRKAINTHRLERAMSTRFIIDSHKMMYGKNAEGELIAGWSMEELQEAYFLGWREDEVNKVKNEMRFN